MRRDSFTLIEIVIVLVILGILTATVMPVFKNTLNETKSSLNEATLKNIKRGMLDFKKDVGFLPDNMALLLFPYEACDVNETSFDNDISNVCKAMIAFVDSRLILDSYRTIGEGDYGEDTVREETLIKEISKRLDAKKGGWRGSYMGSNAQLIVENNQTYVWGGTTSDTRFFLTKFDIKRYYDGFLKSDTLDTVGMSSNMAKKLYPVSMYDFNGSRSIDGTYDEEEMDRLYDIAKYRDNLLGELTILDPWGTPYEVQFPLQEKIDAYFGENKKSREGLARIVSFGPNMRRDTEVDIIDIDYSKNGYDDSVYYIYESNLSNHFYKPKG